MIVITFDEGGYTLAIGTSGSITITFQGQYCRSEQPGPNLAPFPQSATIGPYTLVTGDYGGDRTGAVLLSPFLQPAAVSDTPFSHYSLLKMLEDIYHTDGYLGYADQPGLLSSFGCVSSGIQTKGFHNNNSCEIH